MGGWESGVLTFAWAAGEAKRDRRTRFSNPKPRAPGSGGRGRGGGGNPRVDPPPPADSLAHQLAAAPVPVRRPRAEATRGARDGARGGEPRRKGRGAGGEG
eukprot:8937952-Pyramimonas_sp.AAC.1